MQYCFKIRDVKILKTKRHALAELAQENILAVEFRQAANRIHVGPSASSIREECRHGWALQSVCYTRMVHLYEGPYYAVNILSNSSRFFLATAWLPPQPRRSTLANLQMT